MNNTNSSMDLGLFSIGSTIELDTPPTPTLQYAGTLDGTNASNQGLVAVTYVPEPSSVILLVMGAGSLPLPVSSERRRRDQQYHNQSRAA